MGIPKLLHCYDKVGMRSVGQSINAVAVMTEQRIPLVFVNPKAIGNPQRGAILQTR